MPRLDPPDGFVEFVRARSDALLRSAWLPTGDAGRAEDLLQTALAKAWRSWRTVERVQSPEAYIRRVIFTTHVSSWRRRWRSEVPSSIVPDVVDVHDVAADVATRDAVTRALARLPLTAPPDRIQAVGSRVRSQQRRYAAVSAAAGVTVMVLSVGVLGMFKTAPVTAPVPMFSEPAAAESTPDSSAPEPTKGGYPTEPPKTAKARLKAAAETALRHAAPGVIITSRFPVQHMDTAGSFGYNIGQLVTANGRRGSVTITIQLPESRDAITCANQVAPELVAKCHNLTGPNGERIVSLPATGDGSTNGKHNRAMVVRVARTDGSILTVECDNATKMDVPLGVQIEETDFGINTTSYTGRLPPLTIEQATALALDPTLTMYP